MNDQLPTHDDSAVAEEDQRARRLRAIVDLATSVLSQGHLSRNEAEQLVAAARRRILELFPDKEQTYELILAPRFTRLIEEFTPLPPPSCKVLPFRRPSTLHY